MPDLILFGWLLTLQTTFPPQQQANVHFKTVSELASTLYLFCKRAPREFTENKSTQRIQERFPLIGQ